MANQPIHPRTQKSQSTQTNTSWDKTKKHYCDVNGGQKAEIIQNKLLAAKTSEDFKQRERERDMRSGIEGREGVVG